MSANPRFLGFLLLWVPAMAVLAMLYVTIPPSPDQSQFDWMALIATQGHPFYAGSFDMNWPGAMWLHELGLRMFGVHAWTWRLTDFLLAMGFTVAGAVFLSRSGWRLAPLVFLGLYPPLYVTAGGWMAGQRDIIAAGVLLVACALAMPGYRREGTGVLLAGAVVAAAVMIRPTYLSFLVGLIALEAMPLTTQRPRRCGRAGRAGRLALGFALAMSLVVAVAVAQGNLDDWYQQSVQFSLSVYSGDPPQDWRQTVQTLFVRSWHWITAVAVVGALIWALRDRFGHAVVLALGIIATCVVSFAAQNKGFGYHLGGVLTVLVLFVAVALDGLNRWRRSAATGPAHATATVSLLFVALLVVSGTAQKLTSLAAGARLIAGGSFGPQDGYGLTEAERRNIVALIRSGSRADETVVVYGTSYELAYRSERLPSYRFINFVIDQMDESFEHHDAWIAEIDAALAERPPAFVILRRDVVEGSVEAPRAVQSGRVVLERLTTLVSQRYVPIFENAHVVVYARQPRNDRVEIIP